jgi:cation transport protein ChaC
VTLIRNEASACFGVGYRVREADVASVRAYLDYREKDDYDPVELALFSASDGSQLSAAALCYVGRAESLFEHQPDLEEVARHIAAARGPSGSNSEYCLNLQRALAKRHLSCPHVFEVASRLHHLL